MDAYHHLAKTAAVIQRLVRAGILDAWMHVHSQGLYSCSRDQIKSRSHKGWFCERVSLADLPERLAEVRMEVCTGRGGFEQAKAFW